MKPIFKSPFFNKDRMYGTTTVGTKGQVVIPVEARKDLKIQPGDSLIVMGKFGRVLGLIKTEALAGLVDMLMENLPELEDKKILAQFKKYLDKTLKGVV